MGHFPKLECNTEVLPTRMGELLSKLWENKISLLGSACNEVFVLADQSSSEESPKGNGERSIVSRGSDATDVALVEVQGNWH